LHKTMATIAQESYKLVFGMPLIDAVSFYAPISARILAEGIFASTIRSGWGVSQTGGTEILLEIEFTIDHGFRTDAQILTLASDISAITGTPIRQVITLSIARLVPAIPSPTVSAPSTLTPLSTDVSGTINVGAVGTANIVLTFGTPYLIGPTPLHSWSSNLCGVQVIATTTALTFKANNNQIDGKTINYLCI
jgi:hypothetical protein